MFESFVDRPTLRLGGLSNSSVLGTHIRARCAHVPDFSTKGGRDKYAI